MLSATTYTASTYGTYIYPYISNSNQKVRYIIIAPDGDTTLTALGDYNLTIPIAGSGDTGVYYIYATDAYKKCISDRKTFNVTVTTPTTCTTTQNYFNYSSNSSDFYTYSGTGVSYSTYYRTAFDMANGSTLYIRFGTQPPSTSQTQTYIIKQASGSDLANNECSMNVSSTYGVTATSGVVSVQYISGEYHVKFCNVSWYSDYGSYYNGGKGWVVYY